VGYIARKSNKLTSSLACFGFIGLIASQTIFNLGMCLSLLPVMGVTLPFFSVGGSSAACLYLGIGILQNIYLNRDQTKKEIIEESQE
jgi:rod shape determining protein RodA